MAGMVVDLFLLYQFVKRLATPFKEWDAYKLGIIDEKGKVLKKRKDLNTVRERDAFRLFDVLVGNLKKLLAKVPGGSSRIASYAAALLLLREQKNINDELLNNLEEKFNFYLEEAKKHETNLLFEQLEEDAPTMSTGAAVAGTGDDPVHWLTKKQQKKKRLDQIKRMYKRFE